MKLLPLVLALVLAVVVLPAPAHPNHSAYAEMAWSSDGDTLQVSLQVVPEELETALGNLAGRRVVLDRDPDARVLVQSYLQRHFVVRGPDREPRPLTLLGLEVDYQETWLYFTVAARRGQAFSLEFTLLQDLNAGQVNRLRRLWTSPGDTLLFHAGDAPRAL